MGRLVGPGLLKPLSQVQATAESHAGRVRPSPKGAMWGRHNDESEELGSFHHRDSTELTERRAGLARILPQLRLYNCDSFVPSPLAIQLTFGTVPIMASTLLRKTPALRGALRASGAIRPAVGIASATFVRGKATLPDLPCMSHNLKAQTPF